MSDDITAVIGGDTAGLKSALSEATNELRNFSHKAGESLRSIDDHVKRAFNGVKNTLSSAQDAFMAALGGGGIIGTIIYLQSQTDKAVEQFKKIGDAADAAGVSTDFWQTLRVEAQRSNVEFSKVEAGVKAFGASLGKLKKDYGELHDALKGHNNDLLKQLRESKTVEDGVRRIADAIQTLKDPLDQARLAAQAFGKENAQIAKVFNDGAAGLDAMAQKAREFGVIVPVDIIRHSQELKQNLHDVSSVIDLQFKMALLNIMPVIGDVSYAAMKLAGWIRDVRDAIVSVENESNTGLSSEIRKRKAELDTAIAEFEAIAKEADELKKGKADPYYYWPSKDLPLIYGEIDLFGKLRENLDRTGPAYQRLIKAVEKYNEVAALRNQRDGAEEERLKKLNEKLFADQKAKEADETQRKLLEGQRAMDELTRRYYTDTHQWYEAIKLDQERETRRFKALLDEKKISWKQYQDALAMIAADANAKIKAEQDKLASTLRESMRGISGEFEKILSSWQSGNAMTLRQIERDFVNMIMRMVLKAAVLEPLFGTGKAGQNEFGIVGGAVQSALGSGGLDLGKTIAGIFHEGGVVGEGGPSRLVDADVFAGAARYHDGGIAGLLPGEVPAILQKGETVIPAGAAPGGNTFVTNIQTPNPQALMESRGQINTMLAHAVARGQRNL